MNFWAQVLLFLSICYFYTEEHFASSVGEGWWVVKSPSLSIPENILFLLSLLSHNPVDLKYLMHSYFSCISTDLVVNFGGTTLLQVWKTHHGNFLNYFSLTDFIHHWHTCEMHRVFHNPCLVLRSLCPLEHSR
jgi:hypothetical protein